MRGHFLFSLQMPNCLLCFSSALGFLPWALQSTFRTNFSERGNFGNSFSIRNGDPAKRPVFQPGLHQVFRRRQGRNLKRGKIPSGWQNKSEAPFAVALELDIRRILISYSDKRFLGCSANCVYEKTVPYNPSSAASVGTSFHKIMEEFYSLEPEERDESHLELLRDEAIKENGEEAKRPQIQQDLDGYIG